MKISVVIPTCHRNDLLVKCLECLAPGVQTLPADEYEVIVTDDGSKSTAEQMVREQYSWARWVEGPKKGPAANRNNGAKFAKGEWLAFTDDDCLPKMSWLKSYRMAIQDNIYVYEGKTICELFVKSPMFESPINLNGGLLNSCNFMISKNVFFSLGGFDENFPYPAMEDWDFKYRIDCKSLCINFTSDALVNHPLRRRYWGQKYARLYESHAYFWYKSGNTSSFRSKVLVHMLFGRLVLIFKHIHNKDFFSAFASWIFEVMYCIKSVNSWENKYRKETG